MEILGDKTMADFKEGEQVIILRSIRSDDLFGTTFRELIHGEITTVVADEVNKWGYVIQCHKIEKYSMRTGNYHTEDFDAKAEYFNTFVKVNLNTYFGIYTEDDWDFLVQTFKRMSNAKVDEYTNMSMMHQTLGRSLVRKELKHANSS